MGVNSSYKAMCDIVEQAKDDRSRVGFFIACANSRERMDEIEKLVDEKLKITFE